jgi:hypothetical protein
MVEMTVSDEPSLGAHERPGLGPQIEPQLQLGESPIGLHSRSRVALDRQIVMLERFDGSVIDHRPAGEREER